MLNEKEIKEAAEKASHKSCIENEINWHEANAFELGFEQGVQWALEQLKQKPIKMFSLENKDGVISHHETIEEAERAKTIHEKLSPKKDFWIK